LAGLASTNKPTVLANTAVHQWAPKLFSRQATTPAGFLSDLDGTLVKTASLQAKAWLILLKRYFGIELHPDAPNHFHGSNADIIKQVVYAERGITIDTEEAEYYAAKRDKIFVQLARQEGIDVVPGAKKVLRFAADRGVGIAVATNSVRENAEFLLDETGLSDYVDVVVTASEHAPKPSPALYMAAAEELGVATGRCAVFEDTPPGLDAARRAGVPDAFIIDGTAPRRLFARPSTGETLSFGSSFKALHPALGIRGRDMDKRSLR